MESWRVDCVQMLLTYIFERENKRKIPKEMEAILPFCHFSDDFVFITVQRNGIKTNASWRDSR